MPPWFVMMQRVYKRLLEIERRLDELEDPGNGGGGNPHG